MPESVNRHNLTRPAAPKAVLDMIVSLAPETLDLSVVLPCLNEAENLRVLLPDLRRALDGLGVSWEVIVVDGDSADGTPDVARAEGVRYVREAAKGYGAAITRGFCEAGGRHVLTMDADLSHPARFISDLWAARDAADLVIASRYVPGGGADQPAFRLFLSRVINAFFGKGLSLPARDLSSGFRIYRRAVLRGLAVDHANFAVLMEILLKVLARGGDVAEIPFHYEPRVQGRSHARVLAFGLEYLRLFRRMWRLRNSIDFPDYDWRAHDSRIWFQRYWQRKRHGIILRFAPGAGRVADIGCGSSRILADLPHAIGVDLRRDKLRFMRRVHGPLVQGDGMRLPFADASLDGVISSEIIEHIPDEGGRHIDELLRVLRPGGILVLGTPDYGGWQWPLIEWFYGKAAPGAYAHEHVTRYTRERLREALKERGCILLDEDAICRAELILKARKAGGHGTPQP